MTNYYHHIHSSPRCGIPLPAMQRLARVTLAALATMLSSCSSQIPQAPPVKPQLNKNQFTSFDGDQFPYKHWHANQPNTIIIGIHGISGHANDFHTFADHLSKNHLHTSLYAAETRGQGTDPKIHRRGDIHSPSEWIGDLYTFTQLIRQKHPKARIIWFGESMGSLLAMHAYHNPPVGSQRPDALILASPIVGIDSKLPPWKLTTMRIAAFALPRFRLSLESLSGVKRPRVTEDDIHPEQAAKNPWHISHYTLRLLNTLGDLSRAMPQYASKTHCPTLIIHGGKDIFSTKNDVQAFHRAFPSKTKTELHHYPESFHLILYDHNRKKIFNKTSRWIRNTQ